MSDDTLGFASIVYGVPVPPTFQNDEIGYAVTEYGVQHGQRDRGVQDVPDQGIVTVQQRDDWWKWALGAGIISVGAYAIYQHVTGGQ